MMRRRPGRSVTSMPPSGRKAIAHGWDSPFVTTLTRIFGCSAVSNTHGPAPSGGTGKPIGCCCAWTESAPSSRGATHLSDCLSVMRPPACQASIGPAGVGRSLLAWALITAAAAAGCATVRNYGQADGPILVGPAVAPPPSHRRSSELRLVTFNIKFGRHVDRAAILLSRFGPLRDADVIF